jgi:hypothetical protein
MIKVIRLMALVLIGACVIKLASSCEAPASEMKYCFYNNTQVECSHD